MKNFVENRRKSENSKIGKAYGTICIIAILFLLLILIATGYAWFTFHSDSKGNIIKTSNSRLKLIATDMAIECNPDENGKTTFPNLPEKLGEIISNGNGLVSIEGDSDENFAKRKFFEHNGESKILNVLPNFKQQRVLIVANETDSPMSYVLNFNTRAIDNDLSTAFSFDYTKIKGDIPNQEINENSSLKVELETPVENIGSCIKAIGGDAPIEIQPNSSHIFNINTGIIPTAGSSYENAGMELDIVLSAIQKENSNLGGFKTAETAKKFEDILTNLNGGELVMLINDITISKPIITNNVFNLDLNGHTLNIENNGSITVNYPSNHATMDVGSNTGGHIVNAQKMKFIGCQNLSVLNWYVDIANKKMPDCENVLIATKKMTTENSSQNQTDKPNSSSDSSSENIPQTSSKPIENSSSNVSEPINSGDYSDYVDFNDIEIADSYITVPGVQGNYVTNISQFKKFCLDKTTDTFVLDCDISKIKNIPETVISKRNKLVFTENTKIVDMVIIDRENKGKPNNPFVRCQFYNWEMTKLTDPFAFISGINYVLNSVR